MSKLVSSLNSKIRAVVSVVATFTAFFAGSSWAATTWYASPAGGGDGSSAESPTTVTNALAKAADGDTVVLSVGTFETVSDELRVTNAVTVVGQGAGNTIIKAVNANSTKKQGNQIYRRCFFVNNADAVVKNLTMTDGFWYNYTDNQYTDYNPKGDSNGTAGGGDLVLYAGTIDNCTITGTRHAITGTGNGGGSNGGGVWMRGGTITNCTITGCKAVYNNQTTGQGGGIYQKGGLVVDSTITDNTAGQYAAGVYISGGTMRGCTVSANTRITSNSVKGAIYMDGNCVVENCVITDHSGLNYAGVYLCNNNAKLRNSLICGNSGSFEGAGVYMEKGRVESCTIAGNSSVQATSGTGLYMKNGTAINNVIYANEAGSDGDTTVAGGSFTYNFTTVAISGTGNQHGNAQFVDAANGDYHLIAGSKAIDAAQTSANVTVDLDGVTRPQGTAPDMGCYEYVPGTGALTVAINGPEVTTFDTEGTATFTAIVGGASTEGVTYEWYFDGEKQAATGNELTVDFGLGRHTVSVKASTSTESATTTSEDAVRASSSHVYVNPNGSNTYPYETRDKGAHTVQDALDAVACSEANPGLVTVAAGHYCPNAKWFEVTRPIRLISEEGPEKTSLYGNDPNGASYEGRRVGRVLHVANAQAWVEGFTVSNGWWYSSAGDSGPGGMRMSAGTVTNCLFTLNRGGDLGGAIQMSGGRLVGCDIVNNYSRYNNDGANTYGGGIYMTDGLVEFCNIRSNMACIGSQNSGTGCGVWMSGGTLRDCELSGNVSKSVNVRGVGLAISGGTAERCIITNNSCGGAIVYPKNTSSTVVNNGGGIWQSGGTVRNCLIAGNRAQQYGAGIYQTGGTLEYCTVTANTSDNKYVSGLYLDGAKKAVVRYNVLYGNGAGTTSEPNCNLKYVAAMTFATNVVGVATEYGVGNIYSDPLFADAANGDYTLGTGSPAIDIVDDASVTDDLDGNERPKDGKGEGVPLNDLGCYEAADASAGPLACGLAPLEATGHDSVTVTFTASASGKGSKGELHYTWDFGGGTPTTETDAPEVTVVFSTYGSHEVTLTVRTADGGEATAGVPGVVKVGTSHLYVNAASESPEWPYSTPETAATDLMEAYSTAVFQEGQAMTFDVSAGDYPIDGKWLLISSAVHLRGVDGASATFLRAVPENDDDWARKILCVAHADAIVEGFTFTGGHWQGNTMNDDGGVVRVTAGTIRNCVFANNEGGNVGGHLDMSGGLVTDCVFTNGISYASSNTAHGQGTVYMTGGTLANSRLENNRAVNGGGGIYLNGDDAVVSNCVIQSNVSGWTGYTDRSGGGVRLVKGLLTHCVITDNVGNGEWGGVHQTGGTMRNCLVAHNYSATTLKEGYCLNGSSAVVESCTIADNGVTNKAGQVMAGVTAGSVVNTVFWGAPDETATILSATGGTITYSCWPTATGDTNITGEPSFHRPAKGDYRLVFDSSLIGKGVYRDWMDGATDLKGHVRVKDGVPDIGCYEYTARGMLLFIK